MTDDEAVAVMTSFTPSTPSVNFSGITTVTFRSPSASVWPTRTPVTTYFRQPDGLFCVAVDALCGPQVTMDGIRLVGRVPSELNDGIFEYAASQGLEAGFLPSGDYGVEEFGFMTKVQRAGDVLLTRPVFAIRWANTFIDSFPAGEVTPAY
jgi:hypothetical protein